MDLKHLFKQDPVGKVSTSIGELTLFAVATGALSELFMEMPRASDDPQEFVSRLMRSTAFPPDKLRDGKYKPGGPILADEDIGKLTAEDLDRFAFAYISANEDLNKEEIREEERTPNNETRVVFKYGDLVHPKQDIESNIQYLARLLDLQEVRRRQRTQHLNDSLKRSFSGGLLADIQHTQDFGEELRKSLGTKSMVSGSIFEDMHKNQVEQRWAPFRMLASRVASLTELSKKAIEFAVQSNETQTRIAVQLQQSSAKNELTSRYNIALTYIVIVVGLLGVGVPLYQSHIGDAVRKEDMVATQGHVNEIVGKLDSIGKNLAARNEDAAAVNHLRDQIAGLTSRFEEQSKSIESLNATVTEQSRMLERFRTRQSVPNERKEHPTDSRSSQ